MNKDTDSCSTAPAYFKLNIRKCLKKIIEPSVQIENKRKIFSNRMLLAIILPLFGEQFFMMLVGIADTLMISYAGEEAVSGVSLVNMIITVFLFIFAALGSGGAVIVSQYIGRKDLKQGRNAAGKLVGIAGAASVIFMALVLIFNRQILDILFGSVENAVMDACTAYLRITAYSLPSIAVYNAGSAVYRSMGRTKPVMYISVVSNIINVIGNAVGIFVLHAGVAGVAWPSLIARTFSALMILILCFDRRNIIYLKIRQIFSIDRTMIKRILDIALPSSFEGGIFQLAKVALGTIIAMFGTAQIAANGIAQSFWSMSALIGVSVGPTFITVIGRVMGAEDPEAADFYMIKLLKLSYVISILWNGLLLIIIPFILRLYDLGSETRSLVVLLILIHNVCNALIFPPAIPFANGLRAAGDVKFTVTVAVLSTVVIRVFLSIVFGIWFNLGVIGIAVAMVLDWAIRALFHMMRFKSGSWKSFELI